MRTAKWRRDLGALPRFGLLLFLLAISCRHRQEAAACPGQGTLLSAVDESGAVHARLIVGPAYAALLIGAVSRFA
jgi:hypothetical protein